MKARLDQRRACRRSRRQRHTRYRPLGSSIDEGACGWLPPSLESRISKCADVGRTFASLCPVGALSLELVKFDTQKLENPEISGIEYQQGDVGGL